MEKKNGEEGKNPRKVLGQQGEEIKAKAEQLASWSADISKRAAEYSDIASITILASQCGFVGGDWEASIGAAMQMNGSLDSLLTASDKYYRLSGYSGSAGSAVASNAANLVSSQYYSSMPPEQAYEAQTVKVTIAQFFDRYQFRQKALCLMERFNLAGSVIMEKFKAAWEMFLQNPQSTDVSIGALIPLRSAIDLLIGELIRRRPTQRKVDRKSKVIEIGGQLRDDTVQPNFFIGLNKEYNELSDLLSESKDKMLDRTRQEELIHRGTFFLVSLLEGLDVAKLRNGSS